VFSAFVKLHVGSSYVVVDIAVDSALEP